MNNDKTKPIWKDESEWSKTEENIGKKRYERISRVTKKRHPGLNVSSGMFYIINRKYPLKIYVMYLFWNLSPPGRYPSLPREVIHNPHKYSILIKIACKYYQLLNLENLPGLVCLGQVYQTVLA